MTPNTLRLTLAGLAITAILATGIIVYRGGNLPPSAAPTPAALPAPVPGPNVTAPAIPPVNAVLADFAAIAAQTGKWGCPA